MDKKIPVRPRKRVFIGLMFLSSLGVDLIFWSVWRIAYLGLAAVWSVLPTVVGAFFLTLGAFVTLTAVNLALATKGLFTVPLFKDKTYALINLLFPIAVSLGKIVGVSRRELEGSFVAVSNILFAARKLKVAGKDLLVVTPHCLQLASCPHKITRDVKNCKRCGGCNIGDLVKLSDEFGFFLFVATGGTLARQIIKEHRPKMVLAIACERDLMSGIRDVYPLPAVGVLNIRPNGPCYNTKVDMAEVKAVLQKIILPPEGEGARSAHG